MSTSSSKNLLERLLTHMAWADERVGAALQAASPLSPSELELYAHVLGAEAVWLARIKQEKPLSAVWPAIDLKSSLALASQLRAAYRSHFDGLSEADLAREIAYQNSAGQHFFSRIDDILAHVALHGSYHRGQIAALLRTRGAEPAPSDYIAFVRGAPAARRSPPQDGR